MNEEIKENEIFCPECGKPVKREAIICVNCGMQINELKQSFKQEAVKSNPNAKSKSFAIILAIFFSYFSWIYTYRRNGLKFWIAFWGCSAVIGIFVHFYGELFIYFGVFAVWIWSLIDNLVKPNSFYDNYPN